MKKYIVIYHMPAEVLERTKDTPPEEAAKGMEMWMTWAEKCGEHLVDLGVPLAGGQKLNVDGSVENSEREVCGYSILQAENMDEAKKLLSGHPHLSGWDQACEIEVHEALSLPGMG